MLDTLSFVVGFFLLLAAGFSRGMFSSFEEPKVKPPSGGKCARVPVPVPVERR